MNKLPKSVTITPITKANFPDKIIFVDTESRQKKVSANQLFHSLWFGCALCWTLPTDTREETIEEITFATAFEFWQWVDAHNFYKDQMLLFAHNVKFDFMVLDGFTHLPDLGYSLQSIYNKFTTTVMKFKNEKRSLTVADSMNYYQTSLAKLAPMVGMKKIETDFDKPNKAEIMKRCKSDVRIIYKAIRLIMEKLQAENLGGFKITAPSIAFSIFRSRFLKHEITTHHNDDAVQLEKDSYYGGFVQVFKLFEVGKPDLYKLDINAMYPSVMKEHPFPIQICDITGEMSIYDLRQRFENNLVTADVTIQTDIPYFPYRTNTGVYYPVGTFRTVLSSPSILFALENCYVKKVHRVVSYLHADIFTDFVNYMYSNRLQSKANKDIASEMFYKIMMNSLYGKFGQTATNHKIIGACDPSLFESYHGMNVDTGETFREIYAGGNVIQIKEDGESRYTFYAIAAHVTDYARMKLFSLMDKAGKENVFYSDTDSLIVNETGFKHLKDQLHQTKLGKLKIEDTGNVFMGFAKKDYLLGDKRKLKGFTLSTGMTDPHKFTSYQSSSFFGAMARKQKSGSYWRMVEKIHNPFIKAITVDANGWVVPPAFNHSNHMMIDKIFTLDIVRSLVNRSGDNKIIDALSHWL